jgi:hypothetical protein
MCSFEVTDQRRSTVGHWNDVVRRERVRPANPPAEVATIAIPAKDELPRLFADPLAVWHLDQPPVATCVECGDLLVGHLKVNTILVHRGRTLGLVMRHHFRVLDFSGLVLLKRLIE